MAKRCCGEERFTPFCPLCGRVLYKELTLVGLLTHCRHQAKTARTRYESHMGLVNETEDKLKKEKYAAYAKTRLKLVHKWEKWAEQLQRLLGEQDEK